MRNNKSKQAGSIKDAVAKQYFGQREVFADLFSAFLFRQPGRLDPSRLIPLPTEYNVVVKTADGGYCSRKRERDLAFQAFTDGDRGYAVVCAELQSTLDNTMPLRVMEYDCLGYMEQLRRRLSGVAGKVLPISTIVVNIGREPWRGPRSLHEMFVEMNDFVRRHVPDYRIGVYDPYKVNRKILDMHYTDLRNASYLFRYSNNGDMLSRIYKDDSMSYLTRYGVDFVNVCLDMDLEIPEEGRRLEMCKAVDDLKAMGRKEGREEGRKEGREEVREDVVARALSKGMRHSEIQELTGLSQWRISRIARKVRLGAKV